MSNKKILVTGDVSIDCNIASTKPDETHNLWKIGSQWGSASYEFGSAMLLGCLIDAIHEEQDQDKVTIFPTPRNIVDLKIVDLKNYDILYSQWGQYLDDKKKIDKGHLPWRIRKGLGWQKPETPELETPEYTISNDLIIIDDKRFGFRDNELQVDRLLNSISESRNAQIILRMARPLNNGSKLWTKLKESCKERLTIVFTANDLRDSSVRVSKQLSWEQTILDVRLALEKIPDLNKCQRIIVSFDASAVIVYEPSNRCESKKWRLIYDPHYLEGEVTPRDRGRLNGYTYCLIAAIVHCFVDKNDFFSDEEKSKDSLIDGIDAMQHLYNIGYKAKRVKVDGNKEEFYKLYFPVYEISKRITNEGTDKEKKEKKKSLENYASHDLQDMDNPNWSLLYNALRGNGVKKITEEIVKIGSNNLLNKIPCLEVGKLKIIDRNEIESVKGIRNLIVEYDNKRRRSGKDGNNLTPLSIAVFGTPGSGKSFTIKQIAESLGMDPKPETLEFNLSQFNDPKMLIDAFHQVRDAVLRGSLPFVFWDEFDSTLNSASLAWLRYFLAPMQDGKFQDGQITHPVGPCVFVFAGGTQDSFDDFANVARKKSETKAEDFLSRLKGHLTIKGIDYTGSAEDSVNNPTRIRRAILLRSLLEKHAKSAITEKDDKKTIEISQDVFNAFMNIEGYRNGSRSMESIITMSRLTGETSFSLSCLPPIEQLNIHVDGKRFHDYATGKK